MQWKSQQNFWEYTSRKWICGFFCSDCEGIEFFWKKKFDGILLIGPNCSNKMDRLGIMPKQVLSLKFDTANYGWKTGIDYRKQPYLYRVGKGEQGVLLCEPYKSELVKHWRFKTPALAKKSSNEIFKLFKKYLANRDFVGADMARKFLQMGFTRARRYANYKGGRKYGGKDKQLLKKGTGDKSKAESAAIFYEKWQKAEETLVYQEMKKQWKEQLG